MPVVEGSPIAGEDRGADALVALVRDDLDALVARCSRCVGGPVAGRVVDDDDPVDEVGDPGQGRADEALLVERRDDDGDSLSLEHYVAPGARRDRLPEQRREDADDEADQAGNGHRVARAPRGRLRRRAAVDDPGELDLLGEREQLLGLEPALLESATPLLGGQEQRRQRQAVGRRCALEVGLRLR